ncbi:RHS repeat-associated protein [Lewinella marina]|uniref:RHS repeat-associated core domain-containing protein n=1 Tax=Neolewinella marina TaxID=438751 RepID=A0A2G0CDK7_9BACT|nr:RHS repeat-associated core domain-containing protein [Neolewinella marina]NJB85971.1 RHS repeat-associated protein [Neolewinella marina]PHK98059.1 hypothetical protein CGL56_12775 [Neolewinella marina]
MDETFRAEHLSSDASLTSGGNYRFLGQETVTLGIGWTVPKGTELLVNTVPCTEPRLATYYYYITDHLGNNRVVFGDLGDDGLVDSSDIVHENHYYPFGLAMDGAWSQGAKDGENRYRYNGKELIEELGLYDYGARWYDPAISRWTTVDPLADSYASMSPYNYVANNPINFVDPDGMRIDISEFLKKDESGNYDENARVNLVRFLVDVASITGRGVSIAGTELQLGDKTDEGGGSKTAAEFVQNVIDDEEVVTVVNAYRSEENPDANTGVIPGTNEVQMNFDEVESYRKSGVDVGLEPLNVSGGMRFLHELVHTRTGAKHAGGGYSDFLHKSDGSSDYRPGRTVSFMNKIRGELGFRLRVNYYTSKYNPYHIYDIRIGRESPARKKIYRGY